MFKETPNYGRLDEVLRQLGDTGKYNIMNYALLLFPVYFAGMYGQAFVFEALDTDYRCKIKECEGTGNSGEWKAFAIPPSDHHAGYARCTRYYNRGELAGTYACKAEEFTTRIVKCKEYVYNEKTAVSDFNLGCRDGTKATIAAIHNAGLFLSLPLSGFVSDRFGRKLGLSLASLMAFIFGLLRSFSVNFYMMMVCEFLEAGLGAGAYSATYVLAMEIVTPESRTLAGTILNSVYIFGAVSLGGLAWILHDWRLLIRVVHTPVVLFFSYIWILDDSVRWLLTKGRHCEGLAILKKAAKMNNVTLPPHPLNPVSNSAKSKSKRISLDQLSNIIEMSDKQRPEKPQKSSARQVYESGQDTITMTTCSLLWFTCTLIYHGLSLNSVYIAGNKYINFMMVSFIEIPAYFACLAVLDKYGRRRVITYALIVGTFTCVVASLIPRGNPWIFLSIYLIAKFFITMAYTSIHNLVSDAVPEHLRHFLLAITSSVGRFGAVLAPFTPLLTAYYFNLPAILFGSLSGASVLTISVALKPEDLPKKPHGQAIFSKPSAAGVCCGLLCFFQIEADFFR